MRRLLAVAGLIAGAFVAALPSPRKAPAAASNDEDRGAGSWWPAVKRWMLPIAALLVVSAIGGFLVAASGIIPIKASSGHWAITRWFLNFSKERSVKTNTLGVVAPSLDEPWLVLKGAGHYETGCNPCHGSPKLRQPIIALAMTPTPPYLPPEVGEWDPDELFYIVKHGIKFTGMPAWPSQQRDDEVWAIVAFLRKLPELDAEQYDRLVSGEAAQPGGDAPIQRMVEPDETPLIINESCGRCHGADGLGRGNAAFPKLAGQRPAYLERSLQAYARGARYSGIMGPIVASMTAEGMAAAARYYAGLAGGSQSRTSNETDPAIERGEAIALRGVPDQRVPSCADCHGPGDTLRNPVYPALAGQYAEYLLLQLELFKSEQRGGTEYAHIMRRVASGLTPEQMRDVARYYASLPPAAGRPSH